MYQHDASLIAPCGINCALCSIFQRDEDPCHGCRSDTIPLENCQKCSVRQCEVRLRNGWDYCTLCETPCERVKQLVKLYREKYNTDLFKNLAALQDMGIDDFLAAQESQWACPACGRLICIHDGMCRTCRQ